MREVGWDGIDWIDLAQDRDQWRASTLKNAGRGVFYAVCVASNTQQIKGKLSVTNVFLFLIRNSLSNILLYVYQ
jgi:hypothetical protein